MPTEARTTGTAAPTPADGSSDAERPPRVKALLRLSGEIATKSRRTRARFQSRLAENLRDALASAGVDGRVERQWSRLFVESEDERALRVLPRVFGLSSFSRVEVETAADLERIVEAGRRIFHDRVRGRTYAVRARRSGEHAFSSYDVQRELGAAINPGAEVDLDDPEVEVRVEVRDDRAYLFSDRRDAPGGLPLGVQGKALVLLSGGFDSAVAAWMILRRGVEADYLFCNLGGAAYERMVLEVARVLADGWSFGTRPRIHVADFGPVVERMRELVDPSYLQVVLKRTMYRAGGLVAGEIGAEALVTGESVGQVSSQTLRNLRAIDDAAGLPVLRPLAGFDKEKIVALSREIGTFELSSKVREYCALTEAPPVTAGSPERAREEEDAVGTEAVARAVEERRTLDLRDLRSADLAAASLFVTRVDGDAVVLDTRDREAFERWHWDGAQRRGFSELSEGFGELDPEATYVLVCEEGTRTAHLAERMQAEGYEAYSFRGGARALRRHAREREEEVHR